MRTSQDDRSVFSRRRAFSYGGSAVLAATSVIGCDALSTTPDTPSDANHGGADEPGSSGTSRRKEAPSFATQVQAGKLPPLQRRLPHKPMTIKPTDGLGGYGGTLNTCVGNPDAGFFYMNLAYDGLVRWSPDWNDIVPNLAESLDINKGGREYIFHLRKGVKWSDGKAFTADDIIFAYNDVLRNTLVNPVFPEWLTGNEGEPPDLQRIDAHTIRFKFREPNGLFLSRLAGYDGPQVLTALPFHYFKKFHKKYNTDAERLARDRGYNSWPKLFLGMGGAGLADLGWWQNPDIPTLAGWKVTEPITSKLRLVVERNPYYWKVDPNGHQLPYLDRWIVQVIKDPQVAVLKASRGELSLLPDEFTALRNKPVLARNRKQGGYHFIDLRFSNMNNAIIMLNLTHKDAALREVFQNRDFRIGLSYALDRREIINAVLQRQGMPWQTSPLKKSHFYDERLAKQYVTHDVQKANEHLDRAGYAQRDGGGFRLRADGERISFTLDVRIDSIATWADTANLIKGYWKTVGVDVRVHTGASEQITAQAELNNHDAIMDDGYPGMDDSILNPTWYFPSNVGCQWAIPWGKWYVSGGTKGEEPPTAIRRQMELYDRLVATMDQQRRRELFQEILRIAQQGFYILGTSLPTSGYTIARDSLRNVPASMFHAIAYPSPGYTRPEQYYWDGQSG